MDIRWLTPETVVSLNREIILATSPHEPIGVRDHGGLESALQRGNQHHYYTGCECIFRLFAAVAYGLTKNHPFINANKRTAAKATFIALFLNGYLVKAKDADVVATFLALAKDEIGESELAGWLSRHSVRHHRVLQQQELFGDDSSCGDC